MRKKFEAELVIPEGITCTVEGETFSCSKEGASLSRKLSLLGTDVSVTDGKVRFSCQKANKKNISYIRTHIAHVENMFRGLDDKFVYEMEICNVHFPMTVKAEGNTVVITNFLGEKVNRTAAILPNVDVDIKGQKITITSHDRELAGQTAANIEKASKVPKKDRRVFQDGIFITSKPGRSA